MMLIDVLAAPWAEIVTNLWARPLVSVTLVMSLVKIHITHDLMFSDTLGVLRLGNVRIEL